MKTYHILNGDYLAEQLAQTDINQDFIICRECLIEGKVDAASLAEFWTIRAAFIAENFNVSPDEYYNITVSELKRLDNLPDHSTVCLWFENDLFCQVNMWFILSILAARPTLKIFRVFPVIPEGEDIWKGFGVAGPDILQLALVSKILFSQEDMELGKNLWAAYRKGDLGRLEELAGTPSDCFRYLEAVCRAHIERFPSDGSLGRQERVLKEILETGSNDFSTVFKAFTERAGIYGFGDSQVKMMYDRLIHGDN